jgi:hypothetical protein
MLDNPNPISTTQGKRKTGRGKRGLEWTKRDSLESAMASGSKVTLHGDFGQDVEEGIRERSQPWNPPSWAGIESTCGNNASAV